MVKRRKVKDQSHIQSPNTIQKLLSSKRSKASGQTLSLRTVPSTPNGLWGTLHRLFAPQIQALALDLRQQAGSLAQRGLLGVLGPRTPVVAASTILDNATLNSKYA